MNLIPDLLYPLIIFGISIRFMGNYLLVWPKSDPLYDLLNTSLINLLTSSQVFACSKLISFVGNQLTSKIDSFNNIHIWHISYCLLYPICYLNLFPRPKSSVDQCQRVAKSSLTWDLIICLAINTCCPGFSFSLPIA